MKIVIVGGSVVGLMHGIMFKHDGHNVHIIEQTPRTLEAQAAGIIIQNHVRAFLDLHDRSKSTFTFPSGGVRTIDTMNRITAQMTIPIALTSWDALWFRLRANFDGLASAFFPHPPKDAVNDGQAVYESGMKLLSVDEGDAGKVVVRYRDSRSEDVQTTTADMVIGADGANSTVRSLLYPSAPERRYAGYVLWSGIVPEDEVSASTRKQCTGWVTWSPLSRLKGLVIVYIIPGRDGSLETGQRGVNFAWYSHIEQDELVEALIDIDGRIHHWSVPIGKLRKSVWHKQLAKVKPYLNESCKELAEKIQEPFLQVISDYSMPRASFLGGKVLLVGDALAVLRPHTAFGTSQGALHALLLEEALFEEECGRVGHLAEWERQVVETAYAEKLRSTSWGEYYMGGWRKWLVATLSYRVVVQWTWLRNSLDNLLNPMIGTGSVGNSRRNT